jgi:hypothetical protein
MRIIKDLLIIKRNSKGMFANWDFYKMTVRKGEYSLWIDSGFLCFNDSIRGKPMLEYLTLLQKYIVWRELKSEIKRRKNAKREEILNSLGGMK